MKDFLIFIDESGDPNLKIIDNQFPVFGLGSLIFEKKYFETKVIQKIKKLKIQNEFSESVIFHSSEIRRWKNNFVKLFNLKKRKKFFNDLNIFFNNLDFTIIASVINKKKLKKKYSNPGSPYDLAFEFILERIQHFLKNQNGKGTIFIEKRPESKKDLERVFLRLKKYGNGFQNKKVFQIAFPQDEIYFVDKKNEGIQLADLCIYPITTKILNSGRNNLAFETLYPKIYDGHLIKTKYGLKIFP